MHTNVHASTHTTTHSSVHTYTCIYTSNGPSVIWPVVYVFRRSHSAFKLHQTHTNTHAHAHTWTRSYINTPTHIRACTHTQYISKAHTHAHAKSETYEVVLKKIQTNPSLARGYTYRGFACCPIKRCFVYWIKISWLHTPLQIQEGSAA